MKSHFISRNNVSPACSPKYNRIPSSPALAVNVNEVATPPRASAHSQDSVGDARGHWFYINFSKQDLIGLFGSMH